MPAETERYEIAGMTDRLMTVTSIVHFPEQGTVMHGSIEAGSIRVGDRVEIRSPSGRATARINGIETGTKELVASASGGETVAVLFDPVDFSELADGVIFEEYARVRPKDIVIARPTRRSGWWQVWR